MFINNSIENKILIIKFKKVYIFVLGKKYRINSEVSLVYGRRKELNIFIIHLIYVARRQILDHLMLKISMPPKQDLNFVYGR